MRRLTQLFWLGTVLVMPSAAVTVFSPAAAMAQDQIAPLKIRVGDKAPDFGLTDGSGRTVKLSDFKGHPVLLDFYRGYW